MPTFLHQNVAFAPKYTKVRDIGFVTGKEFVGGVHIGGSADRARAS
jgi:hypothetical protein